MKKFVLLAIFILASCLPAWCIDKYPIVSGGSWTGSIWNTASGQATSNTTVPTTSDTAILDAAAGPVSCDALTCTAYAVDASAYTNTLTISSGNKLTVRQNFSLGTSASTSGGGELDLGYSSTAGTWDTNGVALNFDVYEIGTGQKTLASNMHVVGLYSVGGTHNFVGSGYTLTVDGGWGTKTSYYTHDLATNPNVVIRGGTIYGYLPNILAPATVTLQPDVSDITFTPASGTTYYVSMREGTNLVINDGTYDIVTTDSEVYAVSWKGQFLDNTSDFSFFRLRWSSGTVTLLSDMRVAVMNNVSASFTANGPDYKIIVSDFFNAYGTTNIGGTATLEIAGGMGDLFTPVGYISGTLNNNVNIGINLQFNAPGETITFYPKTIIFDEKCLITYVAGTVVATGVTADINGTVTFDWADGYFPAVTFLGNTDTVTIYDDFETDVLNMYAGSSIIIRNGKTLTVNDNVNGCANELYQNSVKGSGTLADIKSTYPAVVTGGYTSEDAGIPTTGKSGKFVAGAYATFDSVALGGNFTVAFTTIGTPSGSANTVILYGGTSNRVEVAWGNKSINVYGGSTNYWSVSPANASFEGTIRWVITKSSADSTIKLYRNGVYVSGTYTQSNGTSISPTFTQMLGATTSVDFGVDEIVLLDAEKDQSWVTADYNSGAGKSYTSGESDLVAGWHLDEAQSDVDGKLEYLGDMDSVQFAKTDFVNIDASDSAMKIYTWYGSATNCTNVEAVTGDDIGGASPFAVAYP